MKIEKSAGAVIFKRGIENRKELSYLLLQYTKNRWGFPKGNFELGETAIETARREIEEETGLNDIVFLDDFSETIEYYYYNKTKIHKFVIFFLGESKSEDVKISYEHLNYKWLPFSDAIKLLQFKNSKNILKKAHEKLKLYFSSEKIIND
ncbi:MAG: bis(5'-nucleosyl)-tetraphosphatase [Candidatus Helarchaeota archaeon]